MNYFCCGITISAWLEQYVVAIFGRTERANNTGGWRAMISWNPGRRSPMHGSFATTVEQMCLLHSAVTEDGAHE